MLFEVERDAEKSFNRKPRRDCGADSSRMSGLGIEAVTVYSTEDRKSLHRMIAPESVCIGGPRASESYLNIGEIIEARKSNRL